MSGLIGILITILIFVVIFGIIWWALSQVPIPPPFRWVVNVALAIIAILALLYFVGPMMHMAH